jgi:large subunit ribosomal protein L29
MKAHELRQLSDIELKLRVTENEDVLHSLQFQKVLSQLENPMKIQHTKRDIARMKTIIRERELKNGTASTMTAGTPETTKEVK